MRVPTWTGRLVALLLATGVASATTIRRVEDRDLVDRADLVIRATIEGQMPSVASRPATDWLLRVDAVLKGEIHQGSVVVRFPGGHDAEGRFLRIYGAPPFEIGAEAIVFLAAGDDGAYELVDFPQGAFLADSTRRDKVAVRDFSEVLLLERGSVGKREPLRHFDRFAEWIADLDAGVPADDDYLIETPSSDLRAEVRQFTSLEDTFGRPFRWFEFDKGGSVQWRISSDGYAMLTGGGSTQLQQALAAWNNEPNTPLNLRYAGTSGATGGLENYDNVNVVLLKDPNDEISGTYSCTGGGTLAIGGPWTDGSTQSAKGTVFAKIIGGDVVFQNGIECEAQFTNFGAFLAELTTHELGHTLGLDHSSENSNEPNAVLRAATMFKTIHDDGRGASLRADDIAGLRSLYDPSVPFQKSGLPSSNPPPGPAPSGCGLDALCLLDNRFEVKLSWNNQFNGASGAGRAVPLTNFAGYFHFSPDVRDAQIIVKIVNYNGRILVFFTELTVLKFEMTVTDKATGKTKVYSNTTSDCGGIDLDFAQSAGQSSLKTGGGSTTIRSLGVTQAPGLACRADSRTLCLLNGRFRVTLPSWRNQFDGSSGVGSASRISDLTGAFYFSTDPRNTEIFFKVNQFPDRILIFSGSLSLFEYRIHLTDTTSGRTLEFANPENRFCGAFVNDLLSVL